MSLKLVELRIYFNIRDTATKYNCQNHQTDQVNIEQLSYKRQYSIGQNKNVEHCNNLKT